MLCLNLEGLGQRYPSKMFQTGTIGDAVSSATWFACYLQTRNSFPKKCKFGLIAKINFIFWGKVSYISLDGCRTGFDI